MDYHFCYDIKRNILLVMQKYFFIISNIILGSFLLFTYYRGVTNNPEIAPKLWGGVPPYLTDYIVAFMFIGAIGYFFFTYYFIFKVDHNTILFFKKTVPRPVTFITDLTPNNLQTNPPYIFGLIVKEK